MKAFVFMVMCTFSVVVHAQNLRYDKGRLYQDENIVAPKDWESAFAGNSEALQYVKKAKSNYGAAQVIGFAGGFLIGWPLGTAIAGGDPEWALLGAGAGLVAVSIPLTSATKKNMNKAIQLQNGSTTTGKADVNLMIKGNQIGLRIQF